MLLERLKIDVCVELKYLNLAKFLANNIILSNIFFLYFQRVYGVTTATVRVGYEYRDCGNSLDGLVWHIETTRMSGHDLASTDIGGWNLHVQHKYNFHSGILQKGDGNTIYLKYKPQVRLCIYILIMVEIMMGLFGEPKR